PLIEFIGEIGDEDKEEFLGNALALLFPIDWPEPFGMVVIEAMATGTPVIAFNCGSVPELIAHGENGFIVNSVEEAVYAVNNLHLIKRKRCREKFETSYTSIVMADQYVKLYENVASAKSKLLKLNTYSQAK
ncbi:MAG TPA: glycosyltransferase, partial [Chitinophagaceae bacterium]